jgi:hypothetical protein
MKLIHIVTAALVVAYAFLGQQNTLADSERREGWILLFDGRTLTGH